MVSERERERERERKRGREREKERQRDAKHPSLFTPRHRNTEEYF